MAQLEDAIAREFEDAGIGLGVDEMVSTTIVQMVEVRVDALESVPVETIEEAIHELYCDGAATCSVVAAGQRRRNRRGLGAEQPGLSFDVTRVLSANNSLLAPAVTTEAFAEQLGVVNTSEVALSSTSYVEARIAVSVSADTGIDSTALAASHGLPEALASSLAIESSALSFSQEPQLLAPPSVPPAPPPAVADVQTPQDVDAPLDALSDQSSQAGLSGIVITVLALGGGVLLLIIFAIVWKKKRCRLTFSSTATTRFHEVSVEKSCADISVHLQEGDGSHVKDTGLIPSMSTPGVLLPAAPRCSAQSPHQEGLTPATSPTASAALERARSASGRQSQRSSPARGTLMRSSSFGRLAMRGVPARERVMTADSARLSSALDVLDDVHLSM